MWHIRVIFGFNFRWLSRQSVSGSVIEARKIPSKFIDWKNGRNLGKFEIHKNLVIIAKFELVSSATWGTTPYSR